MGRHIRPPVNNAVRANIISASLVAVPMLCYWGVALNEATRRNWPMVIVFGAYGLGNIGLLWALWR